MTTNSSCVVVIPVYKENPSFDEVLSFKQCCSILSSYTICLVCPKGINLSSYISICDSLSVKLNVERFPSFFFDGISGYNNLMTDLSFYLRFSSFQYLLLYQLDAWVFRDELDYWCSKGYDYIGAPWFENYGAHEDGYKLCAVGNGGFSLRRVKYFTNLLSYRGPIKSSSNLHLKPCIKNTLYKFFYSIGYQNTIKYYRKDSTLFEDVFFSLFLSNTKFQPKVPDVETASLFAFEKSPSYLFAKTNKLPFGCHAWRKNEYNTFWRQYINANKPEAD